ncbi:MAG: hypothetical protein EOP45_18905, partial [Sphingobacteriaceae bacterium]
RIIDNLNEDFTDRAEELYGILEPLFQLFANGTYELGFDNGKKKHEGIMYTGDKSEIHYPSRYVQYGNEVDLASKDLLVEAHKKDLEAKGLEERSYDLVDYTTTGLYNWSDEIYFATRPEKEINADRVLHFEQEIKNGKRPFAIVMSANYYESDIQSEYFVLDGHHKLRAYQNLQIDPSVAFISRVFSSYAETEFDLETLARTLYPWQVKHVVRYLDDNDEIFTRLLQDPNSKLHEFIKNGEVKEYYDNGILKRRGFYHNNQPEGTIKEWYDNGNLKSERHYKSRKQAGTWKEWFEEGSLKTVYHFDDAGQLAGQMISYFDNGQKKAEQNYLNGQPEGYGYTHWNHTGKMEYELWYKQGRIMTKKSYNDKGELTRHEGYAPELKRLIPIRPPLELSSPQLEKFNQKLAENNDRNT